MSLNLQYSPLWWEWIQLRQRTSFHVLFTLIGFVFSQDLDSGKYPSPRAYRIFPVMRLLSANQTACMANLTNDSTVNNSTSARLEEISELLFLHYDLDHYRTQGTDCLKCKALPRSSVCMLQLLLKCFRRATRLWVRCRNALQRCFWVYLCTKMARFKRQHPGRAPLLSISFWRH